MSRLSDLLNPVPTSSPSPKPLQPIDTGKSNAGQHARYPSITSPLEALAIAAGSGASNPPHSQITLSSLLSSNTLDKPPQDAATLSETPIYRPPDLPSAPAPSLSAQGTEIKAEVKDSPNLDEAQSSQRPSPQIHTAPAMAEAMTGIEEEPSAAAASKSETQQSSDVPLAGKAEQALATVTSVKKEPAESTPSLADEAGLLADGGANRSIPSHDVGPVKPELLQVPPRSSTPVSVAHSPTVLPTTEDKKPAPKRSGQKKGTASVIKKPAARKRKLEPVSKDGTPFSQRSGTPNSSSRASKTPASRNRKQTSVTPAQSSPPRSMAEADDDEEDDDDADDSGELFCICRGPDDHSWMIGCDGECEDWFHGRCVNMRQEDADLVDKYICPNCADKGIGVTSWKPMCRLEGCRKPARVSGHSPSKYCSDEHGEEFMREKVMRKVARQEGPPPKKKRTYADDRDDGDYESDDPAHLRGGVLKAGELKSLASGVSDASEFKRLGDSVFGPDISNALRDTGANLAQANLDALEKGTISCSADEKARLEEIVAQRARTVHMLGSLSDKEKFLGLVKARASQVLVELNKKLGGEGKKKESMKEMCGFDARVRWSDEAFDQWRTSEEGVSALQSGVLQAPPVTVEAGVDGDGDTSMANGGNGGEEEIGRGVCQKKRCERHRAWYKLQQQELASEKTEALRQLGKLDSEAKGIGERAMLKKLMADTD